MNKDIYIHPAEARRQFEAFAAGPIDRDGLARGALLIALEDYPQLDVDAYIARLDAIAARVLDRGTPREPDVFKVGHLHSEVFDHEHFIGNVGNYYDPKNAYLNEVIDRKIGLPITLSIVVLHIAQRVGLDGYGVGLPGHFMVKFRFELSEIYVDPFYEGRTMSVPEIGEFLKEISSGQVALRSEHLRAWKPRETLARVLTNLENMHARAGDVKKSDSARERIAIINQRED